MKLSLQNDVGVLDLRVSMPKIASIVCKLSSMQVKRSADFLELNRVLHIGGQPYKVVDIFKRGKGCVLTLQAVPERTIEPDPKQCVLFPDAEVQSCLNVRSVESL